MEISCNRLLKFAGAWLATATAVSLSVAALPVLAAPGVKVVKIVVPAPPAGGTDAFFRIVAKEAEPFLEQQTIISNVSGAGGTLGVGQVASAKPDGSTLAGVWSSPITAAPHTMKTTYSPDDYEPVIYLSHSPYAICALPSFPADDGKAFVAAIAAAPDKYTYGNDGLGGTGHLAAERIFHALNLKVRSIPFKGAGETVGNFLGGHVDFYVGSIATIAPHVNSGKAKCLLLSTAARNAALPQASGLDDLGIGAEETLLWRALLAPKGTPVGELERLEAAFSKAMQTPAVKQFCEQAGEEIAVRSGQELKALIDQEYKVLGDLARSLDLKNR